MIDEVVLQNKVRLIAERFLSRRDYPRNRLIKVLVALPKRFPFSENYKACTPDRVSVIVNDLEQEGIIDDYRYGTRLWEQYRPSHGFRACVALLKRRDIKPQVIERLARERQQEILQISPEFSLQIKKKYHRLIDTFKKKRGDPRKAREACYRYLAGRGFTYSEAKHLLDSLM